MAKLVISENLSLDGVMEDPTGEEGSARGGWFFEVSEADREAWAMVQLDEALRAQALLLGRRTEAFFGSRWPSRTGAFADRLNGMPKYVISSTPAEPGWENSTILGGDPVSAVRQLKAQLDGEILVYASGTLVRTLLEHDLVDELRLIVYPVLLGAGSRPFEQPTEKTRLRLLDARTIGTGLAYLTHEVVRPA